jgi:hypothetical protein
MLILSRCATCGKSASSPRRRAEILLDRTLSSLANGDPLRPLLAHLSLPNGRGQAELIRRE